MTLERFFLDTAFAQALLNHGDAYHARANTLFQRVQHAEIWTTEAILVEIGNALGGINRTAAVSTLIYATGILKFMLFLLILTFYSVH